jgi:hypothetical protein
MNKEAVLKQLSEQLRLLADRLDHAGAPPETTVLLEELKRVTADLDRVVLDEDEEARERRYEELKREIEEYLNTHRHG